MGTRALLQENFQEYGVEPTGDVLDKCEEICLLNNVDAIRLVESWMAFSVTNSLPELTLDSLIQMERKEFGRKASRDIPTAKSRQSTKSSSLVIYNTSKDPVLEENLLSTYCVTPKRSRVGKPKADSTQEDHGTKKQSNTARSPRMAFSPASFSPSIATPSSKYETRTNAGQVVCEWGPKATAAQWKSNSSISGLCVAHYSGHGQTPLLPDARFMYEKLQGKAAVLNDVIEWLGPQICERHNLEDPSHVGCLHPDPFVGCGRICCDANGRLNPSSVLLEGSRGTSYGTSVPMKLGSVSSYALFPGQVIAVEGTNPTASTIVAQNVYSDASLPLPSDPLSLPIDAEDLQIVIAASPFTQTDTMNYEPLQDLMNYVKEHKPHILILCGPFLDANHPEVLEGSLAESFGKVFNNIVETMMRTLAGLHTQVVLVPSSRDAHHHPVYPTPPYITAHQHAGLHLMPDPCLLDVNGIVFGITSTDVLMHIGREEICNPPQGPDRLGRLSSHLIHQRSMYPLFPPPEDLSIDLEMWDDHTHLPVTPHILILPSDFRYFLKNMNGCMVVNPERLAKGIAGGTFVRLQIKPAPDERGSLVNKISGEIVRI